MAGRTLMQQALPTTFGLKAAGWLDAVIAVRERLDSVHCRSSSEGRRERWRPWVDAAEVLGAGREATRARSAGDSAGTRRGCGSPTSAPPWRWWRGRWRRSPSTSSSLQTQRSPRWRRPRARPRGVLDPAPEANSVVRCSRLPPRGGSEGPPPGCSRRMPQEHERAAGAWQAEWEPLARPWRSPAARPAALREALEGLEVRAERMAENLAATRGLPMAESVVATLGERVDRGAPESCSTPPRAGPGGGDLAARSARRRRGDSAASSPRTRSTALDPAGYLGSAGALRRPGPGTLPRVREGARDRRARPSARRPRRCSGGGVLQLARNAGADVGRAGKRPVGAVCGCCDTTPAATATPRCRQAPTQWASSAAT